LRFTYLFRGNTIDPLNGEYVGGGAAAALDDLTDVILTSPSVGQVLTFDGSDWVNDDAPSGGKYRAWTYTSFSAGEFDYVVDGAGSPVYSLQALE
jgi:hypothetical protein